MRTTVILEGPVGAFVEQFAAKHHLALGAAIRVLMLKHPDYEAYDREQSVASRSEARAKQLASAAAAKAKPKKRGNFDPPDDLPEALLPYWPPCWEGQPMSAKSALSSYVRRDGGYSFTQRSGSEIAILPVMQYGDRVVTAGRVTVNGRCHHGEIEDYYCSRCEAELLGDAAVAPPPMIDANGQPVEDSPWPTPTQEELEQD